MKVLVINAGSSSLKYQLMDMSNEHVLAKGLCERIGVDGRISHKTADGRESRIGRAPSPPIKRPLWLLVESADRPAKARSSTT